MSELIAQRIGWRAGQRVLIYGIGNVGRQDDGLGIRLVERLEEAGLPPGVDLEANYQLNVEDALLISQYESVIFVDASREACFPGRPMDPPDAHVTERPFTLREVRPAAELAFSTHAMSPAAVMSLCEEIYGVRPRAWLLALPGYEWGISEQMTDRAQRNLVQATRSVLEGFGCTKSP